MTTAAAFFGDPEVLDELSVQYGYEIVSYIVPTVMAMLLVRGEGASTEEKLRIFHDDLRHSVSSVLQWMGDPDNLDRCLDRMIEDGIHRSREIFPAVDAFLEGRFDQFFQEISAEFRLPETG
ncbi:hypothetical protein ACQUQQ_08710 [Acidithiobacillus ferrooxidans]|uniref:hypothetical protein n=1 Tax=Acidithiobacillus ferrooxidans TaxID=920 RepID=UPI000B2FCB7B